MQQVTLEIEAGHSSETMVAVYQTTDAKDITLRIFLILEIQSVPGRTCEASGERS
jgi:hypothetical protein